MAAMSAEFWTRISWYVYPPMILFCWLLLVRGRLWKTRNLPPGPKPLPLVGNIFDVPRDFAWLRFSEWKESFGDVVHINSLGQDIVILNSLESITDLLDRRKALYSGRPKFHMAGDLMGAGDTIGFSQNNDRWKTYKKFTRHALNKQASKAFHPLQSHATTMYLQSLLKAPQGFISQLRLAVAQIILSATYGFFPVSSDDEYITLVEWCLNEISSAAVPGASLVDLIPALKYVPAWFPGAAFQRRAAHVRKENMRMIDMPFLQVKGKVASGTARHSFVADLLQNMENSPDNDYSIKWSAGTMYAAGIDTTFATVLTFISLMLEHQNVQTRAQEEIDQLLAGERLPTFDDLSSLPYCDAVIKEIVRYCPPVRLSLPHSCTQADEYKGYYIPKNATVIPNIWAITRDPAIYENPDKFMPERFMDKQNPPLDPLSYIFGFGSRSCPGLHLATDSTRILVVSILAGFNVLFARDESGNDIIPEIEFTPRITSVPLPFPCRIEPRPKYSEFLEAIQADDTNLYENE